jgi:hypothetical protein
MAEHREVEMLKQRFVLNHANKFSASKTDSGRKKG